MESDLTHVIVCLPRVVVCVRASVLHMGAILHVGRHIASYERVMYMGVFLSLG